jgi:hypothetical protein
MCASTEIVNAAMNSSIDLSTPTELHATIPNILGAYFADIHASINSSDLTELHAKIYFDLGVPIDHFKLSWNMSAPTEIYYIIKVEDKERCRLNSVSAT